ncbi:MAG: alanine--glyoxylate aminotransferase family protein [Methanomassiliicoccales archaeon]
MYRKLFTVGPVEVRKEVLEAMTKPMIVHRGKEYEQLQASIVEKIKKALSTEMNVLLAPCSSTGLLEACVRCGVSRKMAGLSNGAFGERWQSIGALNGKIVQKIDVPWGQAIKGNHVEDMLDEDVEAVTIVVNESSTGVLNPIKDIIEAIRKKHDPLIFLDAVTAAFGIDLKLASIDVDAVVFGTQKALALPPGLAVICASERLFEKARSVEGRGYYFDLLEMKKFADKNLPVTTPPISLMYALDFQLDRILKEGTANRYERHGKMAELVREWASKRFSLFAEEGYRSNTITVVCKGDMDFGMFHKTLRDRGYEISPGYGRIRDYTFRIGHMGDLTQEEISDLLRTIDEILEESA